MNLVRDNPAAARLPSRRHFAIARLIAFLASDKPASMPHGVDHLVLAVDHDQTAVEMYAVSIWMFVTAAWYIAVVLPLPVAAAIAVAIVFTGILIQIPFYIIGAVLMPLWNLVTGATIVNNQKLNSVAFMTLMVIASSFFGASRTSARYPAWFFFAVLVLNSAAWVVVSLLRARELEMERKCGL